MIDIARAILSGGVLCGTLDAACLPRGWGRMTNNSIETLRENYDRLAKEYANRIFDELQHKPLDRELLDRFAEQMRGHGEVCDLGCGPGHIARYLRELFVSVFGLDISPICWSNLAG